MKTKLAAFVISTILLNTSVVAGDEWTDSQVTKAVALAVLTTADWAQTRNIARNPHKWYETNPLLGEHPSVSKVDKHFIISGIVGAFVLESLPSKYRDWALNAGIMIEVGCVVNNFNLGIGVKF